MDQTNTTPIQEATPEQMKNIDAIICIDTSSSMGTDSLRMKGRSRYQELQEDAMGVARECEKYDKDGITVISFSNQVQITDGVTSSKVAQVFQERPPRGTTNLAEALRQAVGKARQSTKQSVVLVYTDGVPDNEEEAMQVLTEAAKELGRPRIGFTIIQVGNDHEATAFLKKLDTGMSVDVLATVSAEQAETLSVPQLVWLAQNR